MSSFLHVLRSRISSGTAPTGPGLRHAWHHREVSCGTCRVPGAVLCGAPNATSCRQTKDALATSATSSRASRRQQRCISARAAASDNTGNACPMNLASSSASVIGRARLPMQCSTHFSSSRPSASSIRTTAPSRPTLASGAASTRSRTAQTAGSRTQASVPSASPAARRTRDTAVQCCRLTFASWALPGAGRSHSVRHSGCTPSRTRAIVSGTSAVSCTSCRQASMAGWITMPQG